MTTTSVPSTTTATDCRPTPTTWRPMVGACAVTASASTSQAREIACQSWTSTHEQWADGTNAGFVRSAQRVAAVLDDDAVSAAPTT